MNFNKFINSDYLKSNPLCGIDTYKDELYLATGACTRKIKKLVLTGDETDWQYYSGTNAYRYALSTIFNTGIPTATILSTHFEYAPYEAVGGQAGTITNSSASNFRCWIWSDINNLTDFQAWLKSQYNNGTPVTIWYVLTTPTTETITVPSGLSGTEEGYLNQSGAPTPANPIYPTANTVEKWFDTNHYIMGIDTDTLTALPAVLYPNAVTATVGLKGNMEQSSQPSPTTPIQPQECGERTGNLWDKGDTWKNNNNTDTRTFFQPDIALFDGNTKVGDNVRIDVKSNGYKYLVSITPNTSFTRVSVKHNGSTRDLPLGSVYGEFEANVPVTVSFIVNGFDPTTIGGISISNIMLNTGSTHLPYEPYGIKIPILSNSTTTPVYLGEVQSTRQIKKYEFTGQETVYEYDANNGIYRFRLSELSIERLSNTDIIVSHFSKAISTAEIQDGQYSIGTNYIYLRITNITSGSDFATYLQQQYSAETPVCIWCVLANPTTGIVNEPLRKIGDYADEVSGISIPTIAGANTLSIGTTLQPSEVTATYKGWHPVADVHERESGTWT